MKESRPDPRQNHTFLAEDIPAGGPLVFPHQAGALVGSVMPVPMPDGRLIWFPAPSFTALYLVEAKRHLDRGEDAHVCPGAAEDCSRREAACH